MLGRVIVLTLITFAFIALDYKKRANLKKSLLTIVIYFAIIAMGYSGYILMRVVAPVMFIHFILLIGAYFALLWYLFRDKLYWQIIIAPIATFILYFVMNHIEGSRYETLLNKTFEAIV